MSYAFFAAIAVFFVARVIGVQYKDRRWYGEYFGAIAVLLFALGLLAYPLMFSQATVPQSAAQAVSPSRHAPPIDLKLASVQPTCVSIGKARILHNVARGKSTDYNGSLDILWPRPSEFSQTRSTFKSGCVIFATGWAAKMAHKDPVSGIAFVIDSHRVIDATSAYGKARPDMARKAGGNLGSKGSAMMENNG